MTFIIRDAAEADVEGIARVHVQAWRETYKDLLPAEALAGLSVEHRAQLWRGAFTHPNPKARLLVAQAQDSEIVGFARGGPTRPQERDLLATEAEIPAIYLLDRVKRQGLGRKLMAGIFDHLDIQGFRSVGLWVLRDNLPARRFYEAFGGRPESERSFDMQGQTFIETAYRFEPIPRLGF